MELVVGTQNVTLNFSASKTTERTVTQSIVPPEHAETAIVFLTGFEVNYTDDDQYGFGKLKTDLMVLSTEAVQATVALRDNHTNEREWQGQVKGMVVFFRSAD